MDDAVAFLRWALPRLGYRYEGFRRVRRQVVRRIQRRVRALGLPGLDAYRRHLEGAPGEWEELDPLLTVTISKFYRDRALFDLLRKDILPDLARRHGEVRCWSAGCASGEEPFTVAIVARGSPLRIVATDRNARLLERAREGLYPASSLVDLPPADRAFAFEPANGLFRLRDELRAPVELRLSDLRRDLPKGPFHLILCRYVAFTYFDEAAQRAALEAILARLAPDGLLALGRHEALPPGAPLLPVAAGVKLFRRA
jgi:chemotaxis protein methyltransferase CheR